MHREIMAVSLSRVDKSSLWRPLVMAFVTLLLCSDTGEAQQRQEAISRREEEPPYLLVAGASNIYRMYPNDSELHLLVTGSGGILSIAYHYRLDYMFWSNGNEGSIKRAQLDGTNVTLIASGDIDDPADMTVDWIHDKLYWTDSRLHRIEEVDIITLERRIVVQLDSSSSPIGLAIYPLQNEGFLYWMDNNKQTLERILTTGSSHAVLHRNLSTCIWPLTVDYRQQLIYWTNSCNFRLESLHINGTNHSIVIEDRNIANGNGIVEFDGVLYWSTPGNLYMKSSGHIKQIYTSQSTVVLKDLQLVHPRSQPSAEELQQMGTQTVGTCTTVCENGGECVLLGMCVCPDGWSGVTCNEDVDECEKENGGCEHVCSNVAGSFQCFCRHGYTLGPDGTSCIDPLSLIPTSSPVTSAPPTVKIQTDGLTVSSPTPKPNENPLILGDRPHIDDGSINNTPTNQITPSHTFRPHPHTSHLDHPHPHTSHLNQRHPHTSHLDQQPSQLSSTQTVSDVEPGNIGQITTAPHDRDVSTTPLLENTNTIGVFPTLSGVERSATGSSVEPSATGFVSNTDSLLPTNTLEPDVNVPDFGGNPPTIRGIDEAGEDGETNTKMIIILATVVAGLVIILICALVLTAVYIRCRRYYQGSYSFNSPVPLDIAGEISTNTLKRGQVTRMSFQPIDSVLEPQATIAILTPRHESTSSSGLSRSDSFHWNHNSD